MQVKGRIEDMLLFTPKGLVTYREVSLLMSTFHHLTLGHTVNCLIVTFGDKEVMLGIKADSSGLEAVLAGAVKDHWDFDAFDGSYEMELMQMPPREARVLHLHPPKYKAEVEALTGKDPLSAAYSALQKVPLSHMAGVSWMFHATPEAFETHGVAFATGKEAKITASYVAAGYAQLGFSHATEPLFTKMAWKNILQTKVRFPKTKVSVERAGQLWHPPVGEIVV